MSHSAECYERDSRVQRTVHKSLQLPVLAFVALSLSPSLLFFIHRHVFPPLYKLRAWNCTEKYHVSLFAKKYQKGKKIQIKLLSCCWRLAGRMSVLLELLKSPLCYCGTMVGRSLAFESFFQHGRHAFTFKGYLNKSHALAGRRALAFLYIRHSRTKTVSARLHRELTICLL